MAACERRGVAMATVLVALLLAPASGDLLSLLHQVQLDGDQLVIHCLLSDDHQGCTPPLAELKASVPAIASTNCGQCTEEEREAANQYFGGLFRRNPTAAFLIQNKYDPTGEFRRRHGDEWRSKGIPIYPPYQPPALQALYL